MAFIRVINVKNSCIFAKDQLSKKSRSTKPTNSREDRTYFDKHGVIRHF